MQPLRHNHQVGETHEEKLVLVRPAFEAYWSRLAIRPAWLRATAIDDALAAQSGNA